MTACASAGAPKGPRRTRRSPQRRECSRRSSRNARARCRCPRRGRPHRSGRSGVPKPPGVGPDRCGHRRDPAGATTCRDRVPQRSGLCGTSAGGERAPLPNVTARNRNYPGPRGERGRAPREGARANRAGHSRGGDVPPVAAAHSWLMCVCTSSDATTAPSRARSCCRSTTSSGGSIRRARRASPRRPVPTSTSSCSATRATSRASPPRACTISG